jgi:inner membrane protein
MVGRSHVLVGLSAGVVLDSFVHLSGPSLIGSTHITSALVINKALFYGMVALGALLPDIDNAHSTLGKRLGWVSRSIQHTVGHRTLFHSILGLLLGALLAFGLQQLVIALFISRQMDVPAHAIAASQLILWATLFGCVMHIAADALTREGVPLLWPARTYFGFPPNRRLRFKTGTWPEYTIVTIIILTVLAGIYYSFLTL